jgi:hypothetical protein
MARASQGPGDFARAREFARPRGPGFEQERAPSADSRIAGITLNVPKLSTPSMMTYPVHVAVLLGWTTCAPIMGNR